MASHAAPSLKGIRDRALLLFGFASALRRSELVGLQLSDNGPAYVSGELRESLKERRLGSGKFRRRTVAMEKAILEIEKQTRGLDEITKFAGTIRSSSEKILDRARIMREALGKQINVLGTTVEDLRSLFDQAGVE